MNGMMALTFRSILLSIGTLIYGLLAGWTFSKFGKHPQEIYEDVFKAWLPDDEYREYLEYRYGYVGDSIDELYKTLPTEDTIQPRTIDSNPYRSDN